ncbi:MAG: GTPase domain-containing protein [Candidatus Thorarchaeota archaeon]
MLNPCNILLTGLSGVGKTTILNLFPGEIILELDDNLNEIFQKPVDIPIRKGVEQCILKEIDLRELTNNFVSYQKLLQSIDIICIITDSADRNIEDTQQLLSGLKNKLQNIDFYIIANILDRKSISNNVEKIENILQEKTFGLSAINKDSKDRITDIIKDIVKTSIIEKKEKNLLIPSLEKVTYEEIWSDIEEARLLEKQENYYTASKKFSMAASKFKTLNSEQAKEEFVALHYLCKAWESMDIAEEYKEPQKYSEAVEFYNQAIMHLPDKKLKLLVLGNSLYCKALKIGLALDKSDNVNNKVECYPKIEMLIKKAVKLYKKSGYEKDAEGTLKILDELNNH